MEKPRPNKTTVIASLAILKVNSDRGYDYIENFVPFAAECLRQSTDDIVSLNDLQNDLRAQFGLEIDQAPLRTILDRVVKAGYATLEKHAYVRNRKALDGLTFADTRDRTLRQVNALVDRLIGYSKSLLDTRWTTSEGEAAFLHYLASRGTSLLASSAAEIPIALPAGTAPNADYVLSSFVAHLHRNDPDGFEFLTVAVKGSVLASVLYFDDFGSISRRFDNLDVYLDTVVLIHALGLVGPEQQAATLETLNLSKQLGARMWCFRETVKEIDGILSFAARYVRQGQRLDTPVWGATDFLIKAGKTASDIDLMAAHLEDDLRSIGVGTRDRPAHVVELTIDEVAFAAQLRATVKYRSDAPLQHDLDAITSIHRLRGGHAQPKIETSKAMFVSTNTSLARATTSFFRDQYSTTSFAPLCMPAHQFGTLAWLKKPLSSPDLPMKLLLADAMAALDPPESLWREYVKEIGKLEMVGTVSVEDCYLLRYSPAAKEALMGITIGGSRAYLQGSVPEILARVRAAERRDAELDAARERRQREEVEAEAARALSEAHAVHAAEIADLTTKQRDTEASNAQNRAMRLERYRSIGRFVASGARRGLLILYLFLVAIQASAYSPGQPFGALPNGRANPLIGIALAGVFTIGVVLSLRGRGLLEELRTLETRFGTAVARRIERMFEGKP